MKKFRIASIILILIFTCVYILPNFQVYASTDYSTIRVKLSISRPQVNINLDGEYMIKEKPEIILHRGAYTISVASNNRVRIKGMGIDEVLGRSLTFIQLENQGNGNNHLRVNGVNRGNGARNLNYLGDMKFTVESGNLKVINHVPLEKYLYGVVVPEMGDSFPLEALKAQAVAARTYALFLMRSRDYLVDTVSHQAYDGYNPRQVRSIRAVDETQGEVLVHNGRFIEAVYSASNGGQTELAGNPWLYNKAYLKQKDDPYDLRNRHSLSDNVFVPKNVEGSEHAPLEGDVVIIDANVNIRKGPSTNHEILTTASKGTAFQWVSTSNGWHRIKYQGGDAYVSADFSTRDSGRYLYTNPALTDFQKRAYDKLVQDRIDIENAYDVKLVSVNEFKNTRERWPGTGSRTYVAADANITVQYRLKGSQELSQPTDLDISLNLMQLPYLRNFLIMRGVDTVNGGYNVYARRFGHGVGMSQRGAEQRAIEGHKYKDILSFYYDGTSLTTINSSVPSLPARPETGTTPTMKSSRYNISSNQIDGISTDTRVDLFIKNLDVQNGKIEIISPSGSVKKSSDLLATGDTIRLRHNVTNQVHSEHTVIIYGDITGNGQINLLDLLDLRRHLLDMSKLKEPYSIAADINQDGEINLMDLLMLRRHLLDIERIKQ